jgi:hypothetical protein
MMQLERVADQLNVSHPSATVPPQSPLHQTGVAAAATTAVTAAETNHNVGIA